MRHIALRRAAVVIAGLVLAACGGSADPAAQPAAPSAAASAPRLSAQASAVAGVQASAAAQASSAAGAAGSASADAAAVDSPYAGLQQSKTPEGYYVLGAPDAPVTLTFYSDFI